VRVLIRPRAAGRTDLGPNNVLCEVIATGERYVRPWRGLRRERT